MAAMATKEVMTYRMQASELGHGPRGPTPLYLDATAVLHGTATEQVSRKMKSLAAKLALVQEARAHGKIRTIKIDKGLHPADFLTKPLQARYGQRALGPVLEHRASGRTGGPGPGTWGRALARAGLAV